jgi:hypothetical protein
MHSLQLVHINWFVAVLGFFHIITRCRIAKDYTLVTDWKGCGTKRSWPIQVRSRNGDLGLWLTAIIRLVKGCGRTNLRPGEHEAGATAALPGGTEVVDLVIFFMFLALSQPRAWATCSCCLGNGKKGTKEADGWEQVSICLLLTDTAH